MTIDILSITEISDRKSILEIQSRYLITGQAIFTRSRDVNKDQRYKDKDLGFKDQDKDKDCRFKIYKDKDFVHRARTRTRTWTRTSVL